MDFKSAIKEYYEREIKVINNLNLEEINDAMNLIYETYKNDGTIYICGNGGSASTASHFQNDFNKGISEYVEKKFRFQCINDNVSTMLAISNDIGYEEVFRFQLKNKITPNDIFIGISGSTGYSGGKLKEISDCKMHVDIMDMQITEDLHMTFDHMMMKIFYNYLVAGTISGNNEHDNH